MFNRVSENRTGLVMTASDYASIPGFGDLYIEDSWVLDIVARPSVLEIAADLVLRESHPLYQPPMPGEQYCYRRGVLAFEGISRLEWDSSLTRPATDGSGESDYGSFDTFVVEDGAYRLQGDFGTLLVVSEPPTVQLSN